MADPPWLAGCLENLQRLGICSTPEQCKQKLCSDSHCQDVATYVHKVCTCEPPYTNGCVNPMPGCCSYGPTSPIYVMGPTNCYCCCGQASSGPWNAASADEHRPVAAFVEGDHVYIASDGTLTKWSEGTVAFRASTPVAEGVRVRIRIERGGRAEEVVAHRAQPFMLADRSLRRAGELVPGVDHLVERDGTPVVVLGVDDAPEGEVHHLATSRAPATSVDGHLVLVNDLVAGDYALQLADIDAINARALAGV
jgi:hypothetical protein